MTVRLVIEHATHPQRETSRTWEGGELVIGRGQDAGWQLDDPDQFLSRRHAIVSDIGGVPHVTDASRGGLFVDGAAAPLGPGNTRALEDGMRLRLGDFVLRVEMQAAAGQGAAPPARGPALNFEFGPAEAPTPPAQRPADLPDPFGATRRGSFEPAPSQTPRVSRPLDMDDPFGLDLRGAPVRGPSGDTAPVRDTTSGPGASSPFDVPGTAPLPPPPPPPLRPPHDTLPGSRFGQAPEQASRGGYFFDDALPEAGKGVDPDARAVAQNDPFALGAGFIPQTPVIEPAGSGADPDEDRTRVRATVQVGAPQDRAHETPSQAAGAATGGVQAPPPGFETPAPPVGGPPTATHHAPPIATQAPRQSPGPDLYAAFLRGAGLPPEASPADAERAMEDAGRHFRSMVEGLMHLLRARALEKQKVRVAVTVMASANVNPLKTLPTAEDGVAALVRPRGPGYLAPDQAIDGAFRDLADHQVRTWTALQQALRRMIDRFDPAEIEAEMEAAGRMKALLAGGRKSLLWQLYEERYREIAQAAEERFLGEVGADFRDAYEGQTRKRE